MDKFPDLFQATKIHVDVSLNRGKKIEEDVTVLRKKIVKAFKNLTQYYVEISHDFVSEFTPEDCRNCYMQIKTELEGRGFVVKGKFQDHALKILVACINPRNMNHKWNLIFKKFLERPLHVPVSPPSRLPSPTGSVYSARSTMSVTRRKKKRKRKKVSNPPLTAIAVPIPVSSSDSVQVGSTPVYKWVNADLPVKETEVKEKAEIPVETPSVKETEVKEKAEIPVEDPLESLPPPTVSSSPPTSSNPPPITIPPLVLPSPQPESDPPTPTIMAGDDEHDEEIDWDVISNVLKKSKKGVRIKKGKGKGKKK
jgi:hypothetical protein